ncbi:MAG: PASTA domain-containing protein, partial [Candidatus Eisenbacteria bacterium]|nr:PASTA domain-containing protein [Candidatus Eisenbacteria bacterium]
MSNGWSWTDGTGGVSRSVVSRRAVGAPPRGGGEATRFQPFDPYAPPAEETGFIGPGDAVSAGLRVPYGEVREYSGPRTRDFLFDATGFRSDWGTPPPLSGFTWDPERYVYVPKHELAARGSGAAGRARRDAGYQHFAGFARSGRYMQPYRVSDDTGLPPWKQWALRLVHVSTDLPSLEEPYRVVSEDTETFFFKPPETSRADPELEGKTAEEAQRILQERVQRQLAGMKYAAKPGTYTSPTGHKVRVYSSEEQRAMKVAPHATWDEYVRDPTLGGRRSAQLGVDWYEMQAQTGGWARDPVTGELAAGYDPEAAKAQRIQTLQERHEWGPYSKKAQERARKKAEEEAKKKAEEEARRAGRQGAGSAGEEYWDDLERWNAELLEQKADDDEAQQDEHERRVDEERVRRTQEALEDLNRLEREEPNISGELVDERRRLQEAHDEAIRGQQLRNQERVLNERVRQEREAARQARDAGSAPSETDKAAQRGAPAPGRVEEDETEDTDLRTVPGVVDLSEGRAKSALVRAGFRALVTIDTSEDVKRGTVLGQDPGAGAEAPHKSTVTIAVAGDTKRNETVPNVKGDLRHQAEHKLHKVGLGVRVVRTFMPRGGDPNVESKKPGLIFAQSPQPGTKVARGSKVTLHLGVLRTGGSQVKGFGMTGEPKRQEQAPTFGPFGFFPAQGSPAQWVSMDPKARTSDGAAAGAPAGGGHPSGAGAAGVTVPMVTGGYYLESQRSGQQALKNARVALERVGLTVGRVASEYMPADDVRAGGVLRQSPKPGTVVPRESTVDLVIAVGVDQGEPAPTPRPAGAPLGGAGAPGAPVGGAADPGVHIYDTVAPPRPQPPPPPVPVRRTGDPNGAVDTGQGPTGRTVAGLPTSLVIGLVPDVRNATEDQARVTLRAVGLSMQPMNGASPGSIVTAQDPRAGTRAVRGFAVKVWFSSAGAWETITVPATPRTSGQALVEVPDVVDMEGTAAVAKLAAAGLGAFAQGDATSGVPDAGAAVVSQKPVGGVLVPTSTIIGLQVSRGAEAPRLRPSPASAPVLPADLASPNVCQDIVSNAAALEAWLDQMVAAVGAAQEDLLAAVPSDQPLKPMSAMERILR